MSNQQSNQMASQKQEKIPNALQLLKADHDEVKKAFKEFEALGPEAFVGKSTLANRICADLLRHATVEEEIFYPVFRDAVKKSDPLTNEALVEHQGAKELIQKITAMDSKDDLFDAHVKVLSEYIDHHVKEEENEIFPAMKKTNVDLQALGEQMDARKRELN